ncbi:response regulator [Paenalkalicoccus suaedae]|uniref:histidine kinase n=1 Tax=Paenalkalicoccus suaedae TaxID=2592382 RepID=A0A859FIY4_9BACI|nr:ATP-binding protein [Paenalkalicoccus suaedae]QKS72898.1 response regulator [Paenalkalicoccus suaedae]
MMKSIRSRFMRSTRYVFIFTFVLITGFILYSVYYSQVQSEDQQELSNRTEQLSGLHDEVVSFFLHVRTYYAFLEEDDLEIVNQGINSVDRRLTRIQRLDLTPNEEIYVSNVASFFNDYVSVNLPQALDFVEAEDYEGLREYGESGINEQIDALIEEGETIRVLSQEEERQSYQNTIFISDVLTFVAIGVGVILILLVYFLGLRLFRQIIPPIEELTGASEDLASGKFVTITAKRRDDELGRLTDSFYKMARVLQDNEEELVSQNEELTAQQQALEETLVNEQIERERVSKYNLLNQAMSTNLDKKSLVSTIFGYLNDSFPVDKSMLLLLDDLDYRAMGKTSTAIEHWQHGDKTEVLLRLEKESVYVVARDSSEAELGVAERPLMSFDLYAAVRSAEGAIVAIYTATKIGREFSKEEVQNIGAMVNHVGLGLERVMIYDLVAEDKKRNQDILDNVNEGLQYIDEHGKLVQDNRAMKQLVYLHEDTWLDDLAASVKDPEPVITFFREFADGTFEGVKSQQYQLLSDKNERVINVYGATVYDEGEKEKLGTVFVHRDMTREHELDTMKSELVSTVSHELRTPLSSVLGFTELLMTKELKPERQKKYLETIYKEAQRLTNLINDFLDLQRMESGKQSYEKSLFPVGSLIMDVMQQFRMEKKHRLSFKDEAYHTEVFADRDRMYQVLNNLISNAIKFSPEGGEIVLRLKNVGSDVVISVADEGLGIPAKALPTLFNKFTRIDQSDRRKIGGTGLGLAITQEIVEYHHGTIWVDSEEGKGSTFYVSLPLEDEAVINKTIKKGEGHVVMIEDDTSLALLLSEELKANGFNVVHHVNPAHAYEDIVKNPPEAIVVDLMLGEAMSGWDLIGQLKESKETSAIPIIISSAMDRSEEKIKAFGVEQYLTKPYPPHKLSATLMQYVQQNEGYVLFPEELDS